MTTVQHVCRPDLEDICKCRTERAELPGCDVAPYDAIYDETLS